MGTRRGGVALALLAAIDAGSGWGCVRPRGPSPCLAPGPALLELRTGDGTLLLALRDVSPGDAAAGSTIALCDARNQSTGSMVASEDPPLLVLRNAAGDVEARISGTTGERESTLRIGSASLRLYEAAGLTRLLDASGVAVAQIGQEGERTIVYDPAGQPLFSVSPVSPGGDGRRAIARPDGSTAQLVIGLSHDRAAAAFAVPGLTLPARALLARFLDR